MKSPQTSTNKVSRTFHYGQEVLYQDTKRDSHLVLSGVGYGKSFFGPPWMEKRRVDNPKSKTFLIAAPTYKLLKKRCFAEYIAWLTACGYREGRRGDYTFNQQDMSLVFHKSKQEIIGLSVDNPDSIISYNAAAIWSDESSLFKEDARRKLLMRLRCPDAVYRQTLDTTTPEGLNHLYESFHPDKFKRHDVISYNKHALILHGRTMDNPYLDESYIRLLEAEFGWDELYWANYILGEWVSLMRNAFYFNFDEKKCVGDYPLDERGKTFDLTWDSNVGQMTWAVLQTDANEYFVRAENGSNGRNIHEACGQFMDRFPPAKFRSWIINVFGDATLHARSPHSYSTGYELIESLLKPHYPYLTIQAHRGNPFVEERSRVTNKLFKENRLKIHRECRKTIASAKQAERDKNGGIKKPKDDTITHAMEAIDMGLICREPPQIRFESRGWS